MEYQQALFVQTLVKNDHTLAEIAEKYFHKYGDTDLCRGPFDPYIDRFYYSSLDGNDICFEAGMLLHKRL
jgi:hypothetical protein